MFDRNDIAPYTGTNQNIRLSTNFYNPYVHGITQGVLGTWLTCPEKARLSLIEGVSAQGSKFALDFGNILHENLDLTYTAFRKGECTQDDILAMSMYYLFEQETQTLRQMLTEIKGATDVHAIEYAFAMVKPVLMHYFKQWSSDFIDREWIALEEEFAVPYRISVPLNDAPKYNNVHEVILRGKIDGVYRAKDGTLWIMDHKTKSVIDDEAMIGRLSFDLQMGFYMYAARRLYPDTKVSGFMYNLIRRPALRQGSKETQSQFMERIHDDIDQRGETYFSRHQVQFLKEDNEIFERELAQIIQGFLTWYDGVGPHYRNSTACVQRGYTCEMLDYCSGGDSPLYQRKSRVYPELSMDLIPKKLLQS
jgi:PD-(D/E)XK nuclease superfamily